jgi:hypothetical protein
MFKKSGLQERSCIISFTNEGKWTGRWRLGLKEFAVAMMAKTFVTAKAVVLK